MRSRARLERRTGAASRAVIIFGAAGAVGAAGAIGASTLAKQHETLNQAPQADHARPNSEHREHDDDHQRPRRFKVAAAPLPAGQSGSNAQSGGS